jgi:CubicO group peptidase (beta-lactamase class C family)
VHRNGSTVTAEFGELEHGGGRPVSPETAFPIGSISKVFTATLSMILVADGDVELDAPLVEHLSELVGWGDQLTLRQVLSHTSGLASGPDSEDVVAASLRRYVLDHCRRQERVLPPGGGFSYSNAGYILAGLLIEKITGMSWGAAMESILLRPLGVDPAFIAGPQWKETGRPVASGHSVNTAVGRTRPVRQSLASAEAPAGALAVSAVDLVSLGLMHVGRGVPDLLPAECAQEMRRAVSGADPFGLADGWGAGLAVFHEGATDWVGHDGNADGTSCHLRVDPVGERIVALTSNANIGMVLWQDLLGELSQDIPIGPRVWASQGPPIEPPQNCIGEYANGDLEYAVTRGEDGDLRLVVDGDVALLTCHDGLTFTFADPSSGRHVVGGRFTADRHTGMIDGIQINGRLVRRSGHAVQQVA